MTTPRLDRYLRELDIELRRRFLFDASILEEVRGHLIDAVEGERQHGAAQADAEAAAIARFGHADIVAGAYAADRSRILYRALFVAALACGLAIAFVDSRPTWDDSGVTAGVLTLAAGLFGLLGPRRPWAWALLVGIWIPGYAIVRAPSPGSFTMVIVLLFPLAGAYAGRTLRRWSAPDEC